MTQTSKIAIVTGGLSGIGLAIAKRLAKDGTKVVIGSRRGDEAELSAQKIGDASDLIESRSLDVQNPASVTAFVEGVISTHERVDILVNAAGIYEESEVINHPEEVWMDQIDINLSGTFRMIRAVMPQMKQNEWGRIINMASVAAHQGMPGNAAYCASKAGLLGLSRCVSLEGAAYGVTCVSISPTWVETEMLLRFIDADVESSGRSFADVHAEYSRSNPQNKLVQPTEVAELAAFLASDAARALTMEDYQINAGSLW